MSGKVGIVLQILVESLPLYLSLMFYLSC